MKRRLSDEFLPALKRPRSELVYPQVDPFHHTLQLDGQELFETAGTSRFPRDGYVLAAVKLVRQDQIAFGYCLRLCSMDGHDLDGLYQILAVVPLRCASRLALKQQDRVLLSLRGCKPDNGRRDSTGGAQSMTLRYPEGAIMKVVSRAAQGSVLSLDEAIHTCISADSSDNEAAEWFNSPPTSPFQQSRSHSEAPGEDSLQRREMAELSLNRTASGPLPGSMSSTRLSTSQTVREDSNGSGNAGCMPSPQAATAPSSEKLSKTKKRKLQQAKKEKAAQSKRTFVGSPADVSVSHVDTSTPSPVVASGARDASEYRTVFKGADSIGQREQNPSSASVAFGHGRDTDITAPQRYVATELGTIQLNPGDTIPITAIAIVERIEPISMTATKEFSRSLYLVDPSNIAAVHFLARIFKLEERLLPSAKPGDVVILRNLKVKMNHGTRLSGTGYKDSLRWATYDSQTEKFHYGDNGETFEPSLGGFSSPFLEPTADETMRCEELSSWWKSMQMTSPESTGATRSSSSSISCGRQHHLLSEVSPQMEAGGFFKCTVEVRHIWKDTSYDVVYATDYTHNDACYAPRGDWCPPNLAPYIFKFEFWDGARELVVGLQVGDFLHIDNAKAKDGKNKGYGLEAKLNQKTRSAKLDLPRDDDPHLSALLERRLEFLKYEGADDIAANDFPFSLLKDASPSKSFKCMVEVKYKQATPGSQVYVCVTDYTYSSFFERPADVSWASGLQGGILAVFLVDGQEAFLSELKEEQFYLINGLNLEDSPNGKLIGRLRGQKRLFDRVARPDASPQLRSLLGRKQGWGVKSRATGSLSKLRRENCILREVAAADEQLWPLKFRVRRVRVVEYRPGNLKEAAILTCVNCHSDLSGRQKECVNCKLSGKSSSCTWRFRLSFCLEDVRGDRLWVTLNGPKLCKQLHGLKASDFESDVSAFHSFVERLQPVLGAAHPDSPNPTLTCLVRAEPLYAKAVHRFSLTDYGIGEKFRSKKGEDSPALPQS